MWHLCRNFLSDPKWLLWATLWICASSHAESFRYPIAMVLDEANRKIFVANERSGTLSSVHLDSGKVEAEISLGKRLKSLIAIPSSTTLLALDFEAHQLVVLENQSGVVRVDSSLPLASYPLQMSVSPDQKHLAVSSLWSRTLSLFHLEPSEKGTVKLEPRVEIPLSFAPGELSFSPNSDTLFVADYFGGHFSKLNVQTGGIEATTTFPANNIGGLYWQIGEDSSTLWMTSESLNPSATTFSPEVQWGVMMGNHLRALSLKDLEEWSSEALTLGKISSFGDETGPGGDPARILMTQSGVLITSLAGVDRVAFKRDPYGTDVQRVTVGDRPIAMALSSDENILYVANYFSDTISLIDVPQRTLLQTFSLGTQPTLRQEDRGERLFYDASLSMRGWFSCHSCHTDGHASGQMNDNLGDDDFGAPKRILSLLGIEGTGPFSWRGTVDKLEDQIHKSLEKTMLNYGPKKEMAADLAAYIRTLPPAPSLMQARKQEPKDLIQRGEIVFNEQNCAKCHAPPLYTTPKSYDVGLKDLMGRTHFNPPSLRGVSQRETFFHDNSATDLKAVFKTFQHPWNEPFTEEELTALLAFLGNL